jgi:hypothetical protein
VVDALPSYFQIVSALGPVLQGLPGKIIGIDGRDGVGKTTLGRYLAWRFNVTLLESDLFLKSGEGEPAHRLDEINRIIQFRLDKPRPIILEGVGLFHLLQRLGRCADYVVYCQSQSYVSGSALDAWLGEYDRTYRPQERADLICDLTHENK